MRDWLDIYGPWLFIFGIPFAMFVLALATGCGDAVNYEPICPAQEYIVGGTPSVDRRATAKVYLGGGYCSGTVIGPHTVLTAGHCKDPESVAIEGVGSFEVVENVAHPDYNGNTRYDLRILYTATELPPPYVSLAGEPFTCTSLLVQGYGVGSDGALHERRVQTAARYDEIIIVTEGSCNGDSGGPLYAVETDGSYTLIGVTSFGSSPAPECEGAGGYMNLLVLGEWVEGMIR